MTQSKMSPEEVTELMTGGLLGEVYAGYKFSRDDLMGLSEQGRMKYIKEEISKNLLKEGLTGKERIKVGR